MKLSIALTLLLAFHSAFADNQMLDFWDEEIRLFGAAGKDAHVDHDIDARRLAGYSSAFAGLDHADKKVGDLSLVYRPQKSGTRRFGFVAGLYGEQWQLNGQAELVFWLKAKMAGNASRWSVRLLDTENRIARTQINVPRDEWSRVSVSLDDLQMDPGFSLATVRLLEFEGDLTKKSVIKFDGVRFVDGERVIGVLDKTLQQRLAEAEKTRAARVEHAFDYIASQIDTSAGVDKPWCIGCQETISAFAMLMMGKDLDVANTILRKELAKSSERDAWSLSLTPLYIRYYYMFSSRNGQFPGRLEPEVEKLLLETLWERTKDKNDIAWSRESTWWMDGSENHDLNAKASNLVTSRIFMDEPDYKDRVYPNYGFGGGYHYGRAGYYGTNSDEDTIERHGGGRAELSDGIDYTAADHYAAWVEFFETYFRERAERGFFLEYGSPTYTYHSLNFVDLVYQYSGDAGLKKITGDFLTMFWADWAQVSISGVRGGPKTRHHGDVGGKKDFATAKIIGFHLGGAADAGIWSYWNLLNDFELPPVLWNIILDREALGEFTYLARGIGEEENEWPRPLGTERTLVVDTESRFLKSTRVTPDYTLGTQMDHPAAVHSHLSMTGRWHGMTFAQSPDARIVPVGLPEGADHRGRTRDFDTEILLHTLHHDDVLIAQRAKRWFAVHPEWYPAVSGIADKPIGVWFGSDWDELIEKKGWVFVRSGNAFAAVRPVFWDEAWERENQIRNVGNQIFFHRWDDPPFAKLCDKCYSWNEERTILELENSDAPVVIQAGRSADYTSFDDFIADVLDNPLKLHKSVVPGFHTLIYSGNGESPKELVYNAGAPEIPMVGGQPVDHTYPMSLDSPYLKSRYNDAAVEIRFGDDVHVLSFEKDE